MWCDTVCVYLLLNTYPFWTGTVHFLIVTDPGGQRRDQSPAQKVFGRLLSEPGRFAYAALCGVSLGQLFQGPEQK